MSVSSSQPPNYTKEVRFAVVMYGGVSLAIYINGIAQELLRLVRSTAPTRTGIPAGTERIYRKVSQLLAAPRNASLQDDDSAPMTRFVVDILSGTSAGGINGIFLAKALANGQDMDQLKDLWVREGDIETLINDKKSIERPLAQQDPPTSLLNSERMYYELLKAFQGMDQSGAPRSEKALSPYVEELDLFVTSTDLQGVVLPIHLSDDLVYERRHRNVLHFVYSSPDVSGEKEPRNDFHAQNNSFLAYAARCTSSFPFAFEPMCLCDTDELLSKVSPFHKDQNCRSGSTRWQKFYRDYLNPNGVPGVPFPKRAFGDGGYLDNKPFAYATEMMMKRSASVPVDRKLIYIEPSPEHPEDEVELEKKPDAIDNVVLALMTLPRHETIREDLQRVLERNRLVERLNRIIAGVDRDARSAASTPSSETGKSSDYEWGVPEEELAKLDLAQMARRNGPSYAAYCRLRIASVTDDLAKLVTRVAGYDEESSYYLVIRNLIQAWRDLTYVEHRDESGKPTLNEFLFQFDLAHPMRRLNYLRRQIDVLYGLDDTTLEFIAPLLLAWSDGSPLSPEEEVVFRQTLLKEKQAVNEAFIKVRQVARSLRARPKSKELEPKDGEPASVRDEVENLARALNRTVEGESERKRSRRSRGAQPAQTAPTNGQEDEEPRPPLLDFFLTRRKHDSLPRGTRAAAAAEPSEQDLRDRATNFLESHEDLYELFNTTAEELKRNIMAAKIEISRRLLHLSSSTGDGTDSPDRATQVARDAIGRYYHEFETYDLITYPILYDTNVGEADIIDIIRVSPEDAKQLINEGASGCHKLAGTALANFGAFLQKLWRQNDILWGRLDAAERIISALLPDHPSRTQLIGEAQAEIICETLAGMGEKERCELLSESMMRTGTRKAEPQLLSDFITRLKQNSRHNPNLSDKLDLLIKEETLRQHYLNTFQTQHQVQPETAMRSAARATTVIGKMMEGLSETRRVDSKYAGWLVRVGRIFWSLVEVAVPRSFPELFFRHFLKLVYFLEALLIAFSTILLAPGVQRFALTAFGVTAATHLVVVILGDWMKSRNRWANLAKTITGVVLVVSLLLGFLALGAILGWDLPWRVITRARDVVELYSPFAKTPKRLSRILFSAIFFVPFLWVLRHDIAGLFKNNSSQP